MNTYKAFFKGKQIEVTAETSLEAQVKAAEQFKARKRYEVSVVLVAVGEREIIHNGNELP